jgi:HEAT repeat protein
MAQGVSKRTLERLTRRGDVVKLREILARQDVRRTSDGTLVDQNWQWRVATISALAEIGDADAEDAIVAALGDPAGPVRHAAVDALAAIGTATWSDPADEARRAALRVLQDIAIASVAVVYAQGLVGTDSQFPPDELDEALVRGYVEGTSPMLAGGIAAFLAEQLASEDQERAGRAEVILGWLGTTGVRAAEEAVRGIDGAEAGAARVLGRIGEESSIPTLREVLEHGTNAEDRRAAAVALTEMRTPLAIEPLLVATRDADRTVRDAALAGLDTYGTMATVAMIGGVIHPAADPVHELPRPEENPEPVEAHQADAWRRKVLGLLSRLPGGLDDPE